MAAEAVLEQRRVLVDVQLRPHQDALLLVPPARASRPPPVLSFRSGGFGLFDIEIEIRILIFLVDQPPPRRARRPHPEHPPALTLCHVDE